MEATPAAATRQSKASPSLASPRFTSPKLRKIFEEKEEMQNLNDRLAVYIDRMRNLEDKNSSLVIETARWREKEGSEVAEVKSMFQSELSNARQLLDDIAKEKSKVELENSRNFALVTDLQKKLDKETQVRSKAEEQAKILDRKLHDRDAAYGNLQTEYRTIKDQFEDLKKENSSLQDSLNSDRYDLEQRTLDKVDLENRIQTLIEDSDFKKRMYEKEISEMKTHMKTFESTTTYMETDFKQKYDTIMSDKLHELRDEFEEEADNIRNEVESNHKEKLDELRNSQHTSKDQCDRQIIMIREIQSSLESLKVDKSVLETEIISYKKRIEELERLRSHEKDDLVKQLKDKSDDIEELKDTIEDLHKQYEKLMGIKVALDLEISAYRKLIEGEEARLNITPTESPSAPSRKRPRMDADFSMESSVVATAKGSIQISECDTEGKFVKIFNSSANEEPLGGWVVQRKAGEQLPAEFKFSPRSILKGETTVTIWSASSGMKHKPPTDLVMKTIDWAAGPESITTVQNSEGEVVAQMTETPPHPTLTSRRQRRRTGKNESCVIS